MNQRTNVICLFAFVGILCVIAQTYAYGEEWEEFFRDMRAMRNDCVDADMCETCARVSGSQKAFHFCCQGQHGVTDWCKKFLSFGLGRR